MKAEFVLTLILTSAPAIFAQSGITPPRIGLMRDPSGVVRPLLGLAANFWLGTPVAQGVISSAFSGQAGLLKTSTQVLVVGATGELLDAFDAPAGPAVFSFARDGSPALVYYPLTGELLRWATGAFEPVSLDSDSIGGEILALSPAGPFRTTLLVLRDDRIWKVAVSTLTGQVRSQIALPEAAAPLLLLPDGRFLFSTRNGVMLRRTDGSEASLTGCCFASLTRLGQDWILARESNSGRSFALRIAAGQEQAYQVPEGSR